MKNVLSSAKRVIFKNAIFLNICKQKLLAIYVQVIAVSFCLHSTIYQNFRNIAMGFKSEKKQIAKIQREPNNRVNFFTKIAFYLYRNNNKKI